VYANGRSRRRRPRGPGRKSVRSFSHFSTHVRRSSPLTSLIQIAFYFYRAKQVFRRDLSSIKPIYTLERTDCSASCSCFLFSTFLLLLLARQRRCTPLDPPSRYQRSMRPTFTNARFLSQNSALTKKTTPSMISLIYSLVVGLA